MTITEVDKRAIALKRAEELKGRIAPYLTARERVESGLELSAQFEQRQQELKRFFGATDEEWNAWHWQIANRISDVEVLEQVINLTPEEKQQIQEVGSQYRWAISPYYASLMSQDDPACPIRCV